VTPKPEDLIVVSLDAWMACPKLDYPVDDHDHPLLDDGGLPELDSSLYDGDFIKRGTVLTMTRHWYSESRSRRFGDLLLSGPQREFLSQHVYDGEAWRAVPKERWPAAPLTTREKKELIRSCQ